MSIWIGSILYMIEAVTGARVTEEMRSEIHPTNPLESLSPMDAPAINSRSLLMWEKKTYAHDNDEDIVVAKFFLAFMVILLTVVYLQYFIGKKLKFHYFPESGIAIAVGMIVGAIIRLTELYGTALNNEHKNVTNFISFSTTLFFIGLLPPIIFNSGYQIKHHLFFANMGGITSLAFYGTASSAFFVGLFLWICGQIDLIKQISFMELLCFGSLISATDPVTTLAVFSELKVDPNLFYLVFGESVLNDAIGISLFHTTSEFVGEEMTIEAILEAIGIFVMIFTLSCLIGYGSGILSAGLFKAVDLSHHPVVMMTAFVAIVYIPFLISEVLQLSGIVTILFSAITLKRYCVHSIPPDVQHSVHFFFEVMAFIAETAVFIYLGFSVFAPGNVYNISFILLSILFCLIFRAAHVYPIFFFLNRHRQRKEEKRPAGSLKRYTIIPTNMQHMIFFSGLRGAVAYALSNVFPDDHGNQSLIIGTTMVIVLVSVFLLGGLSIDTLKALSLETGVDFDQHVQQRQNTYVPNKFVRWEQRWIYPFVLPNHLDHIERDNHGIRALEMSAQEKGQHTDTKSLSPELDQTESPLWNL